ncbi:hypothetical protein BDZ91DRAFT_710619 [Kalaharituber pfeilii]|nr:hypothetical protein BDZ91DRAFT_710619 [Kalaharituber pfeilii]
MLSTRSSGSLLLACALAVLIPSVHAHEEHTHHGSVGEHGESTPSYVDPPTISSDGQLKDSYYLWPEERFFLYSHIALMVVAWVFILPVGLSLGLSRSRLYYPSQVAFLGSNFLGLAASVIYNGRTPDLYPNNSHHKMGWVIMGLLTLHTLMGIFSFSINPVAFEGSENRSEYVPLYTIGEDDEQEAKEALASPRRNSGDSGLGAERLSSSEHSVEAGNQRQLHREEQLGSISRPLYAGQVGAFFQHYCPYMFNTTIMKVNAALFSIMLRLLPIIGFVLITTGVVVFTGIFVGPNVLNGLAHTIKGGIFFWYGVFCFGRWLGAFSEFGWAWNIKPESHSKWINHIPTCEMIESSLILFYGTVDVFLEHLAAWGHSWTHMDLEHESIAILFFGGGLCGVMLESKMVRNLLSQNAGDQAASDRQSQGPMTSYNLLPGLVIFLLGKSIGAHHQSSSLSVTLHTQWGQFLSYAGILRTATYILHYISPVKSTAPSRPPTEVVASFCLMAGGLIFMLSNKDTVAGFEKYDYQGSFVFTLIVALTAFLMGWITVFMAVKGWGIRRLRRSPQL